MRDFARPMIFVKLFVTSLTQTPAANRNENVYINVFF